MMCVSLPGRFGSPAGRCWPARGRMHWRSPKFSRKGRRPCRPKPSCEGSLSIRERDLETLIPLVDVPFGTGRPLVVAHRGSSGTAPENTMAAIVQGVEAGAEMVEIDGQHTSEGRLIVFHDQVLGRTTSGTGRVAAHTYEQIARLDAGSWMDGRYAGEPVPLLLDVLEYLRGRAYL